MFETTKFRDIDPKITSYYSRRGRAVGVLGSPS